MLNRRFSERLNKELDNIGLPETTSERIDALAKLIKVPKYKAELLLNGITNPPDEAVLQTLAEEFEVNVDWLLGKSDSKESH